MFSATGATPHDDFGHHAQRELLQGARADVNPRRRHVGRDSPKKVGN